jgi:4-amino-4-deoxy-L-arabinose transferase-like glycosyltransferase
MAGFDRSRAQAWSPIARSPVAWTWLLGLALIKLGIHLLSSVLTYGYMTDELYYLDCADHLAWGYVDHPPLSVALLALLRLTIGDSLIALRLVPALAGSATIVLVGLMARELGGSRVAQGLAALATLVAPVYFGIDAFYSMNAFEPPLWALAAYLLLRLENGATPRLWLLVGVVIGLGLLNKISMLWFGLGLVVGLLLTPQRRWLRTPWPWLAGAIGLALFAPHITWQARNGWPTLEFMHNAMQFKMQAKAPLRFLAEQVLTMHPLLLPFWLSGLAYYFIDEHGCRFRLLAWIWISVLVLLVLSGSTRSNYMAPAYVMLLPAGGVAVEQLVRRRSWNWLPPALAGAFAVGGAVIAPMAVDLLPPEQYVAYQHALGLVPPADQVDPIGVMPLHFALKFHAPAIMRAVKEAYAALPAEDRARAGILASSFGEAGAINFFGPHIGLPHAISAHNNYWLWGPGAYSGEVMLVFAPPDAAVLELFDHVEVASRIRCDYCLPALTTMSIYICRGPRRPLPELWPQLKNYV